MMSARRFFAVLSAGRRMKYRDESLMLMELCDIAPCALGDHEYHKQLRAIYQARSRWTGEGEAVAITNPHVLDMDDPGTAETVMAMFNGLNPKGAH